MKTLLLFALIAFASCSKPSDVNPNGIEVSANAVVVNRYWNVALSTPSPITSKGTATVEWEVYGNGTFLYTRSATVSFVFDGASNVSALSPTTIQGAVSMSSRNAHVVSISGSGGYTFK